jgi:hypothetical protein
LAVTEHSARVAERLKSLDFDETQVRKEHAGIARLLLDVAVGKMARLNPDTLSTDQALAILRFAPAAMREALGMADLPTSRVHRSGPAAAKAHFEQLCNRIRQSQVESEALEEFEKHVARRERAAAALRELTAIVEGERDG